MVPSLPLLRQVTGTVVQFVYACTLFVCGLFQIFISKSYDATTHFETTCTDVLDMYRRATGGDFDFSQVKHTLDDNC